MTLIPHARNAAGQCATARAIAANHQEAANAENMAASTMLASAQGNLNAHTLL